MYFTYISFKVASFVPERVESVTTWMNCDCGTYVATRLARLLASRAEPNVAYIIVVHTRYVVVVHFLRCSVRERVERVTTRMNCDCDIRMLLLV